MALITVGGEPGCRIEEVARAIAQRLGWELVTDARVQRLLADQFGDPSSIPARAYPHVVLSVLARLATEHHAVAAVSGSELITRRHIPGLLRVQVIAPESWRAGAVMLDRRLDRKAAHEELARMEKEARDLRRSRIGRALARSEDFDLTLNASGLDSDAMAAAVESAATASQIAAHGLLNPAAEAQLQFQLRVELSKHGMSAPDRMSLKRSVFVHPTEEMFANVLDFYRIAWEYEPKSFPIQWDRDGKVTEAFTPDFYLPEFDLYVELTAMKQANVTRKNRKIKLVRQLYPHVNVQIWYQKDLENLIFKYGLADRIRTPGAPEAVQA